MPSRAKDKFRAAINAGAPASQTEAALDELRRDVESYWQAASAAERQVIAKEITSLLEWARQTILVRRAHTQSRLARLTRHGAYVPATSRRLALVEFEG